MGRKRRVSKAPVQAAQSRFRKRMQEYEKYQFQNLSEMPKVDLSKYDLDLDKYRQENLLEDMPGMEAHVESADWAAEKFRESQANIMQAYRGAAGASGAAGLAQAMSGQATKFAREQQMGLGQRVAEARRLALQEQARLNSQEMQLMLTQDVGRRDLMLKEDQTRREFDYGKMTTLLGVEGEQVSGARQMYASELQAGAQKRAGTMGMIGSVIGAAGAVVGGLAYAGAFTSDRRLKKNIKKEGKSPKGLQLYSFEYKDPSDGKGRWQGVIADDLPTSVKNKVVTKSADGYDMVNYSKIDATLKQV